MTDPTPSFTISSRIISVSPKRIETGSCTSIKTARLAPFSCSGLLSDVSIHWLLSSGSNVSLDSECFMRRIHLRFRVKFVFAADFDDHRPVLPLVQHQRVADLQRQQRFH